MFINEREKIVSKKLKKTKAFIDYLQAIDDVYENLKEYNPTKKRKVLLVFDDMIADMDIYKRLSYIATELFLNWGRNLNISKLYFKKPKTIRVNAKYCFIIKISNKRELKETGSNHSSDIKFKDFIKLYKDYNKEPFPFLVNDTTLPSDNAQGLKRTYHKTTISKKIKTIHNKVEQNKAQYDLDRQIVKISTLSSGNVDKYEFLTRKDVLSEKFLLEKPAPIKRFEYSLLGSELKEQIDIAKTNTSFLKINEFW